VIIKKQWKCITKRNVILNWSKCIHSLHNCLQFYYFIYVCVNNVSLVDSPLHCSPLTFHILRKTCNLCPNIWLILFNMISLNEFSWYIYILMKYTHFKDSVQWSSYTDSFYKAVWWEKCTEYNGFPNDYFFNKVALINIILHEHSTFVKNWKNVWLFFIE
jgi:hypothetical protein